eukprot:CAMPEP_0181210380 /NCGR_PEP_ID=MMETSP1096-20121128/23196_1 /TAXON_ID=156174 ORGANISM="Chrysochromulina ericina, Strain CCMP281" /NCGR_SAMPLE_ID=MMETSP1096 /ASSEMBLY_ACC=CAM_ASM_000453 /LENGTH=173 /DNA_ID=CAMNT_0023301659 /DNA_START=52 /DNA_END=573 /DNA_ORIENTATION=-
MERGGKQVRPRSAGGSTAKELLSPLLLNEAQCRLKLQEANSAADLCTRVLGRDPDNVKALYRRAVARMALKDFAEARRDLFTAAKLEPSNREVRSKLSECKDSADAQRKQERQLYAAMLQGGVAADPAPTTSTTEGSIAPAGNDVSEITGSDASASSMSSAIAGGADGAVCIS